MPARLKKYKKAISYQIPNGVGEIFNAADYKLKDKCCKSYKDKKGEMCKRCPKLIKVLKKEGLFD